MGLREWYIRRWLNRAREGKEGVAVMKTLAKLQGLRSAIIALVLLLEFLGQKLGFGGGVLQYAHSAFVALGWDTKEALFDPTVVGTALLTLWATWGRAKAWWKALPKGDAVDPAQLPKALVLLALVPFISGCGSMAQVRLGREPLRSPDDKVVLSFVCRGELEAAHMYLDSPEFAWLGPATTGYLTRAEDIKLRCGCAKACEK